MEKQLKVLQQKETVEAADSLGDQIQDLDGLRLLISPMDGKTPKEIQSLAVSTYKKNGADILVMGGAVNGKIFLNALCSDGAIAAGYKAGEIVCNILQKIGGKGGGKPDFATGGGKDNGELPKVLETLRAETAGLKNS